MIVTKKIRKILGIGLSLTLILGTINVSANQLPEEGKTGSITIHKYKIDKIPNPGTAASGLPDATLPEGSKPLEGVTFKIEKVADDTLPNQIVGSNTDNVVRDNSFTAEEIKTSDGENGTNKGEAKIENLPQGIYLVTELDNAGVLEKVNPFLVSIPMAHPLYDEDKPIDDKNNPWLYDVHVYPKNVVTDAPSIDKYVTSEDNKHSTANIGENVTWIIKPSIPGDIEGASKYVIIDILDTRLNYTGNLKVFYVKDNNEVIIDSNYYNLSEPVINSNPKITGGGDLSISFNDAGRKYLAERYREGISEIRVTFTTIINASAELGKEIFNNATLKYTNSFGTDTIYDPSEKPEVHTGGLLIEKVDALDNNVKLQGAKFKIYKTLEEAKNGTGAIMNPEDQSIEWEITTNNLGVAEFKGLAYGTYWIVETLAPQYDSNGDGNITVEDKRYNLLTAPLEVSVNEASHKNEIVVKNRKFTLPLTGGKGTVIFTVGGLILMGAAIFIYIKSNKKEKK